MKIFESSIIVLLYFVPGAFAQVGSGIVKARETLEVGVKESDPIVRREVALALGLLGKRDKSVSYLETLMTDKDVQVRVAAIGSLADLQDHASIPSLRKALDDDVPEVAFAAAKALWALKQPIGKEVLLSVLEGEMKVQSNFLRRKYRGLTRAFSTPKGAILFTLNQGIGFVPVPGLGEGFSGLQALLWDSEFSARASVPLIMAKEPDATTRQALIDATSDKDWSVRASAAQALAIRNRPELRNNLVPLFDDRNYRVRFRAAAAYLRLSRLAERPRISRQSGRPAARREDRGQMGRKTRS